MQGLYPPPPPLMALPLRKVFLRLPLINTTKIIHSSFFFFFSFQEMKEDLSWLSIALYACFENGCMYSWFHEKGSFSVHSFNDYYLSIPECTVSWGNHFQEIPGTWWNRLVQDKALRQVCSALCLQRPGQPWAQGSGSPANQGSHRYPGIIGGSHVKTYIFSGKYFFLRYDCERGAFMQMSAIYEEKKNVRLSLRFQKIMMRNNKIKKELCSC